MPPRTAVMEIVVEKEAMLCCKSSKSHMVGITLEISGQSFMRDYFFLSGCEFPSPFNRSGIYYLCIATLMEKLIRN